MDRVNQQAVKKLALIEALFKELDVEQIVMANVELMISNIFDDEPDASEEHRRIISDSKKAVTLIISDIITVAKAY